MRLKSKLNFIIQIRTEQTAGDPPTRQKLEGEYYLQQVFKRTNVTQSARPIVQRLPHGVLPHCGPSFTVAGSELFAAMVCCTGFGVAVCLTADCLV